MKQKNKTLTSKKSKKKIIDRKRTPDEFFTPYDFVKKIFSLPDPNDICIDHNAGEFVWGMVALEYKLAHGIDRDIALSQIFCTELQLDNCINGIKKLYGDGKIEVLIGDAIPERLKHPAVKACFRWNGKLLLNVLQCDSLKYHWQFGGGQQISYSGDSFKRPDLFSF
jgi:hypothetical protein